MLRFISRPRKAITLRAFTSFPGLASALPPTRLSRQLPEWWARLDAFAPKTAKSGPGQRPQAPLMTAKHCYSMQETFKNGIGLPLWGDHHLVVDAAGEVHAHRPHFSGRSGMTHPPAQYPGALVEAARHFKLFSPWAFVCEEPVQFVWTHPFYHQPDPFRFHTMTGIVEYRNQHSTNVNLILPRVAGQARELTLAAGEIVAYVFAMSERPVQLVIEEASEEQIRRINFAELVSFRPINFRRRFQVPPFLSGRDQ